MDYKSGHEVRNEREDFLNKYSNIILWIGDLKKLEMRVTSIIEDFFSENPVP